MGEDTLVWEKVLGSQKKPRKGCSRAILWRQRKNVRAKTHMVQAGRGRVGVPVARRSAEKAPQAVE